MKIAFSKSILAAVILALFSSGALGQAPRIGTVDLGKVFDNYWKTKQAQGVLKERREDMEKELKNMLDDGRKAKEAYDKLMAEVNDPAMSTEEKARRRKEADEKLKYMRDQEETMNQYRRQAMVTLDEQTRRLRENILGEIRTIVDGKSKTAGYTLVIDTAAESNNRTPVFLYVSKDNDLTQDVLKELNAAAPAETGAAPSATKPDPAKK